MSYLLLLTSLSFFLTKILIPPFIYNVIFFDNLMQDSAKIYYYVKKKSPARKQNQVKTAY